MTLLTQYSMNKKFIQSLITITKTRAEIERLESENNCGTSDFIEAKRIAYNRVKRILDSLPEQPASESSEKIGQLNVLPKSARHSEGLEEAAENIYKTPFGTRAEDFKAGAEWQKEQDTREMIMSDGSYFQKCYELGKKDMKKEMLEDAIEGRVGQTGFHNSIYIKEPKWCDTLNNFNNGDKVRVIIIKED